MKISLLTPPVYVASFRSLIWSSCKPLLDIYSINYITVCPQLTVDVIVFVSDYIGKLHSQVYILFVHVAWNVHSYKFDGLYHTVAFKWFWLTRPKPDVDVVILEIPHAICTHLLIQPHVSYFLTLTQL